MTHENIIAYLEAIKTSRKAPNRNGSLHRCPCCGEPLDGMVGRSRSFEGITICLTCQSKETYMKKFGKSGDWANLPNKPETWWIIQTFDKYGSFPSDIHFQITDPEVNDDKTITFLCECWFNWGKFGQNPAIYEDDDTWINVYLTVNPATNELFMEYTIDDNDKNESFVFVLNAEDREAVLTVIDTYCKQHGETLQDIVDSIPMAEQEFEIPVKEINYGIAKIRATSLEAALEKIHDAYGAGNIEWGKTDFEILPMLGGIDNA